ncbi:low temperature requirement protein A [Micromonospora sp. NPDC050397]|uniref:low temperature requirement protein A n=1 Tax=Micromonospora sp. NPDC050397 TaxID=3364279 RepID=UPI00384DE6CF
MTTGVRLVRGPGSPMQPAFLELFYDLVYVFALTQITHLLVQDLSWRAALRAFVLLLALWWIWVLTAWLTDQFDPQHPLLQLYVILVMLGVLLMAIVLPQAFARYGLLFAVAYVAIHLTRHVFIMIAEWGTQLAQRSLRAAFWFTGSALLWIPGAFAEGWLRVVLWLAALTVDYVSAALRWPAPGLGEAPGWELTIQESHLAERYRQVLVIALGEIILILGLTFAQGEQGLTLHRTTVLVFAFASTALMWRLYIYRAGEQLAPAIAASSRPHRLSQWSSYAHMVMVAGILLTAVGFTVILEHPDGNPEPGWTAGIAGGPALFLAGRSAFEYVIFGRVSRSRWVAMILLAAVAGAAFHLPPVATAAAGTFVLAAVALFDTHRAYGRAPEPPAPPT